MRQSDFYSDYKKARDTAWEIIFKYNVDRLPVAMKKLCKDMNLLCYSYEDGKELIDRYKLQPFTINDGFSKIIKNRYLIFYNETIQPHARKRFTVAHEIGHIVLGHLAQDSTACRSGVSLWNRTGEEPNPIEASANVFAGRLLAPACVLHALDIHCKPMRAVKYGGRDTCKTYGGAVRTRAGVAAFKGALACRHRSGAR